MTARTPAGTPPPAARITILDILRALALLGIVIVHTHDHFNLYLPMPPGGRMAGCGQQRGGLGL